LAEEEAYNNLKAVVIGYIVLTCSALAWLVCMDAEQAHSSVCMIDLLSHYFRPASLSPTAILDQVHSITRFAQPVVDD
jgi:hypothetical protein